MRELTEELKLKFQHYSNYQLNNVFIQACEYGYLDVVKYLLTSTELTKHANIHAHDDAGFRWACENGHLDIVKYLLTSPELTEHADIHAYNDYGFRSACEYGHLDIVKYLLTSPELKEHADIHAKNNGGFQWACEPDHVHIIQYLLKFPGNGIDFQKTEYNLEWAISYKRHNIVKAMIFSLYKNDMQSYIQNLSKIESYAQENKLDFQTWKKEMKQEDRLVNPNEEELLL